jgi:beta-glucosidase
MTKMKFPKHFVWGVATAAYQIEGAAKEDGRGDSVWDMFCRRPGSVWNGQTGEVACDHYHRYKEDVALMKLLGVGGYRFSLSWPRILPNGVCAVNPKGVAFYDRLVDELLARNITPYVTLFHWDYPTALYKRGGWLKRDSADWFADYTRVVMDALSDRVRHWITMNEPQCFIGAGHFDGFHAPGDKLPVKTVARMSHHAMLAHGKSVQVIRAHAKLKPIIGYAPIGEPRIPVSEKPADIRAAREATFANVEKNFWSNSWWADPPLLGTYPEDGIKLFGIDPTRGHPNDLREICQPLDFLGINTYRGPYVRAGRNGTFEVVKVHDGFPIQAFYWNVTPEALYWVCKFFAQRYNLPLMVTENGMANVDWVALDGRVHDPQRIDFTHRYLLGLRRAIAEGVDVRGYFHWSLMDNFEWAEGFRQRFGLVYVDYPTQKRIPKDSFYWYQKVIKTNGACLALNRRQSGAWLQRPRQRLNRR